MKKSTPQKIFFKRSGIKNDIIRYFSHGIVFNLNPKKINRCTSYLDLSLNIVNIQVI